MLAPIQQTLLPLVSTRLFKRNHFLWRSFWPDRLCSQFNFQEAPTSLVSGFLKIEIATWSRLAVGKSPESWDWTLSQPSPLVRCPQCRDKTQHSPNSFPYDRAGILPHSARICSAHLAGSGPSTWARLRVSF